MKRFMILLALIATPFFMWGGYAPNATLTLHMLDGTPVFVEVDGSTINRFPNHQVHVRHLHPGRRYIRVWEQAPSHGHGQPYLVYEGWLRFAPQEQVFAKIDRRGRLYVDRQNRFQANAPTVFGPQPTHYGTYNGYTANRHNWGQYQPAVMSNASLNAVARQMRRASFEDTKLAIAKGAIDGQRITARQLRNLLYLFSFERTKLTFATWAMPYVTNPNQMHLVYEAFSFDSSIRQLSEGSRFRNR